MIGRLTQSRRGSRRVVWMTGHATDKVNVQMVVSNWFGLICTRKFKEVSEALQRIRQIKPAEEGTERNNSCWKNWVNFEISSF